MPNRLSHLLFAYILPIISILGLLTLFGFKFLAIFQMSSYVIGFDSPTHMAMIDVYKKDIFPSLWGWITNWYTGMPIPLFYPPAAYYIGCLLLPFFGSSLASYKALSYLGVIFAVIVTFIILKKMFAEDIETYETKSLDAKKEKLPQNVSQKKSAHPTFWQKYFKIYFKQVPIILAITTIFTLNPGAPSVQAIANGILSNQFSVVFLLIALFCLLKKGTLYNVGAAISLALVVVSNAHTFMAGTAFFFFLCILIPFAYTKKEYFKRFFTFSSRVTILYLVAMLTAACWLVPMLTYYRYFTGTHTVSTDQSTLFFQSCGIALLLSFIAIFIAHYEERKKLRQIYLAIFVTFIGLFIIDIIQRQPNVHLTIPIQLWRWYETMFFLSVIPFCHLLFFTMKRYRYIAVGILFILSIISAFRSINTHGMDRMYIQDNIETVINTIASSTPKEDIITTFSGGTTNLPIFRQTLIDASIGSQGNSVVFSNLRESSINAIFLRIAKTMVSRNEESWALVNYAQSSILQTNPIETQAGLLNYIGIKKILLADEISTTTWGAIDIRDVKSYSVEHPYPEFAVLTSKKDISRISEIQGPLTLLFAQDGFRDRLRTEPTYTRFQETTFEKGLYKKTISFSPTDARIEKSKKEMLLAKYIVIADLQTDNLDEAIATLQEVVNQDKKRTVYILTHQIPEIKALRNTFARNAQIHFIEPKNDRYPFDDIATAIIKNEKNNIKEKPLKAEFLNNTVLTADNINQTTPIKTSRNTQNDISNKTFWFVRQSYFPAWKAIDNQSQDLDTYLASPGYTLVIPKSKGTFALYFDTPDIVIKSHIASLIGLGIILLYASGAYTYTAIRRRKTRFASHRK